MAFYNHLPWIVRVALDAGRVFGALKGLAWLWAVIINAGVVALVLSTTRQMPTEARVVVVIAGVFLAIAVVGHAVALYRSSTGDIRFMSDRKFASTAATLATDIEARPSGSISLPNSAEWTAVDQIQAQFLARQELQVRQQVELVVRAVIQEAVKRKLLAHPEASNVASRADQVHILRLISSRVNAREHRAVIE